MLYRSQNGEVKVEVYPEDETVWMTQKTIGILFEKGRSTITEHLQNIFESGELDQDSVCRNFRHTATDGKNYQTKYYNLDAIISVGYRVNSFKATQFRIWATKTLKEYMLKGFVLDDDRLKQGKQVFGKDYFDELLERIGEIRASERRFYQKITDIYALSMDYDKETEISKDFFASVQNKLHWAISGKTAAEIVYSLSDSSKINMGLTSWKQAPGKKILKSDVSIAKNYLNKEHIKELNQIVSSYLDFAENRATRKIPMKMEDWVKLLDKFLELSNYPILEDKGKVSAYTAKLKAEEEFEKFRVRQDKEYVSDFDKEVKRIVGKNK